MSLSTNEIRSRAYAFVKEWENEGSERAEAQSFWNDFFSVFGLKRRRLASYEAKVKTLKRDNGRIDLLWPGMLLAEHKSAGQDLDKAFTQAIDYLPGLVDEDLPKYLIISDFQRIRLFNLEDGTDETFPLSELPNKIDRFLFIAGYSPREYKDEDPLNIEAAEKLGAFHDALEANGYTGEQLELYLIRILFLLFAEDTGILGKDDFRWLIENKAKEDGSDLGALIQSIFEALDTPPEARQKNLDDDIASLPHVNGSLFSSKDLLRQAHFDSTTRELLLNCCRVDWTKISPAIFGSLFQSGMKKEERRSLGAHYTSEKNVLKLIHGLFLDELKAEFEQIKTDLGITTELTKTKRIIGRKVDEFKKLDAFHNKLASLKFLDPACGCGNFLIITYRELRLLETEILKIRMDEQALAVFEGIENTLFSKIDVDQMFGIEIDDFAARIAEVALYLTDHQMNMKLSEALGKSCARLPLKKAPHIWHKNALRCNWEELVPKKELSYILGNPPFIGDGKQTDEQKEDMGIVCSSKISKYKSLDYVATWYVKTAEYIEDTNIKIAFVSTNSITQGEQVGALWDFLLNNRHFHISFAHRTFKWTNEAKGKAAVFVIIIGLSKEKRSKNFLFEYEAVTAEPQCIMVSNISPYLIPTDNNLMHPISNPICNVPPMNKGSQPTDGGNLILTEAEKDAFLRQYPEAKPFIKPFIGAEEYINGFQRYCIWLHNVAPNEYRHIKGITERIEAVRKMRLASKKAPTRKMADYPNIFTEIRQSQSEYILVPSVSSENRFYVPMGYLQPNTIASNLVYQLPNATCYHFGVLISHMHMAWMRQVCGRLEGRYRYSNKIVYNNFPWPSNASDKQTQAVESAAQGVLDARQKHLTTGNTLADLYDPNTMPVDLLKAHQALDKAVDKCYRPEPFATELERVTYLFELYKQLTQPLGLEIPTSNTKPKRARKKREGA